MSKSLDKATVMGEKVIDRVVGSALSPGLRLPPGHALA